VWQQGQKIAHHSRGAAAVEMAIALPVLLLLIFGTMEVGFLMWTQVTLSYAVEQAARCGALNLGTNGLGVTGATICQSVANIQSYAVTQAVGIPNITTANFTVTQSPAAVCGTAVQVTASYDFTSMVPDIVPYALTLSASSCYPIPS
jgi:Flp pilus assembly protein TadG